jgi:hypothetical protein
MNVIIKPYKDIDLQMEAWSETPNEFLFGKTINDIWNYLIIWASFCSTHLVSCYSHHLRSHHMHLANQYRLF